LRVVGSQADQCAGLSQLCAGKLNLHGLRRR
jgi:hypothetical protein